jgi:hypothetical protein
MILRSFAIWYACLIAILLCCIGKSKEHGIMDALKSKALPSKVANAPVVDRSLAWSCCRICPGSFYPPIDQTFSAKLAGEGAHINDNDDLSFLQLHEQSSLPAIGKSLINTVKQGATNSFNNLVSGSTLHPQKGWQCCSVCSLSTTSLLELGGKPGDFEAKTLPPCCNFCVDHATQSLDPFDGGIEAPLLADEPETALLETAESSTSRRGIFSKSAQSPDQTDAVKPKSGLFGGLFSRAKNSAVTARVNDKATTSSESLNRGTNNGGSCCHHCQISKTSQLSPST